MTPDRWRQVRAVLEGALERSGDDRSGYLDAACAGDASLRNEVESLLAADRAAAAAATLDVPPSELQALAPGQRLGPYEVGSLLGAGGMGEVYRARDTRLDREVAVKVLPVWAVADPERRHRLDKEARAVGALNHPNVVAVYDVGLESGVPYVVSELLEGETLAERLRRGALPTGEGLDCARQIAAGLSAAHDKGLVHRDLKPANVFLTRAGVVKILDFGLVKRGSDVPRGDPAPPTTATGVLLGTVGYVSPEQVRGLPIDCRSDVFSLGAVLYEVFTGRRAFPGSSLAEAVPAVLRDEPPPSAALPPAVDAVVRRCLRKDPAERFASAGEVHAALLRLSEPAPPGVWRRVARWPVLGGAAVIVTVAALALRGTPVKSAAGIGAAGRPSVAVLAFEDHTTDPAQAWLAKGLPSLLVTGLAQTPGLDVVGESCMASALAEAGTDGPGRGRAAAAARRCGAGALLDGSVVKVASGLRVDLRLEDVASGRVLVADSVQGGDLLAMTDALVGRVRAGLEISGPVQDRPVRDLATPSLAAYQIYLRAMEARHNHRNPDAYRLLKEAVRLDPSFSLAWAQMANVAAVLGDVKEARENRRRALANADRLPERQRLLVEAQDARELLADAAKAVERLETLIERYPDEDEGYDQLVHAYSRDPAYRDELLPFFERWRKAIPGPGSPHFHNHYGYALLDRGLHTDAQREFETYIRLRPDEANPYDSLGELFLLTGRPEKALEQYRRALSVNPSFGYSLLASAWAEAMLGRYDPAFSAVARLNDLGGDSGVPAAAAPFVEAFLQSRVGRYRDAERLVQAGIDLAARVDNQHHQIALRLLGAMIALERGRAGEAQDQVARAEESLSSLTPLVLRRRLAAVARLLGGGTHAASGDLDAARRRLAALRTDGDLADRLQRWAVQALEGELALAEGDPSRAERAFRAGLPDPRMDFVFGDWPLFVLANGLPSRDGIARARAAKGDLTGAIDEYQRLMTPQISSRWTSVLEPRYVLARARLARRAGQAELAASERRRFVELWKGADAGLNEAAATAAQQR
jgi:tetratricopeptide (TPR) repeat protein/TolB-like protein